jgi:hypothetical protein
MCEGEGQDGEPGGVGGETWKVGTLVALRTDVVVGERARAASKSQGVLGVTRLSIMLTVLDMFRVAG